MSQYKKDGPLIKNPREQVKVSHGQLVKGYAKILGKDIFPEIKMPKQKRPYKPRPNARKPHNMRERIIEKAIIRYLRGKGFKCGKVNPEVGGWNKGVADITCWTKNTLWFIEVKTKTGRQSKEQKEFQKICSDCGTNYLIARSVDDVKIIS